jgi:hypothetical protein
MRKITRCLCAKQCYLCSHIIKFWIIAIPFLHVFAYEHADDIVLRRWEDLTRWFFILLWAAYLPIMKEKEMDYSMFIYSHNVYERLLSAFAINILRSTYILDNAHITYLLVFASQGAWCNLLQRHEVWNETSKETTKYHKL